MLVAALSRASSLHYHFFVCFFRALFTARYLCRFIATYWTHQGNDRREKRTSFPGKNVPFYDARLDDVSQCPPIFLPRLFHFLMF